MSSYDDPEYRPKGARYGRPTFLEFLGIGSNYKPKMPMAAYSDYLLNRDPVGGRVERDQARKVYEAELALFEAENRRRDQQDIVDEYGKDAFRARTLLGYDPKDFKSFENPELAKKRAQEARSAKAYENIKWAIKVAEEAQKYVKKYYGLDIDRPPPEMANREGKKMSNVGEVPLRVADEKKIFNRVADREREAKNLANRPTPEAANRKKRQKKAGGGRIKKTYAKGGGVIRKPKMGVN